MTLIEQLKRLGREEIRNGARLSLDNAKAFLGEGLVFESRPKPPRYCRANSSYQLCLEETGKAALLLQYHEEKAHGLETDFEQLSKAFSNHQKKTVQALEILRLLFERRASGDSAYREHVEVLKRLIIDAPAYSRRRESGLYVSIENGRFIGPDNLISKEDAAHTQLLAHNTFSFVEQWWCAVSEVGYKWGSKGFAALGGKHDPKVNGALPTTYLPMLRTHIPQ